MGFEVDLPEADRFGRFDALQGGSQHTYQSGIKMAAVSPGNQALTPGTLIDGARMYAAAADAVNDKLPNALHVLSHLLGMSIELALKAFLRHHGMTDKELRELGHDLGTVFEKAHKLGLSYTGSRSFRLKVLDANYKTRFFAYPEEANLVVIEPRSLRELAHDLITDIFAEIKGQALLDQLKDYPDLCVQSEYPEETSPSAWASDTPPD